jgi:hypothetical protein
MICLVLATPELERHRALMRDYSCRPSTQCVQMETHNALSANNHGVFARRAMGCATQARIALAWLAEVDVPVTDSGQRECGDNGRHETNRPTAPPAPF